MKYLVRLPLAVPVLEVPEVRVPAALLGALEPAGDGRHRRAQHDRDDHHVLDDEVVHLDEEPRPLHRIQLALRRAEELVVLLVAPARDVAALELVVLVETSHDVNWFMKVSGSGCVIVVVYIWMSV